MNLKRLNRYVRKFGCSELVPIGRPTKSPEQIQYLDLIPTAGSRGALLPEAVAEFQGRPVMYLLDGTQEYERSKLRALQQRLANRGDHAVLALARPGDLTLYPLNLDFKELQDGRWETILSSSEHAPYLFHELACGAKVIEGSTSAADPVFTQIHRLLKSASVALAGREGAGPLDGLTVLSMTGRALFFRFLIDRRIVREEDLSEICPKETLINLRDVFSNARSAAKTSAWLDETFNGDLLPLVDAITKKTPPRKRRNLYLKAYQDAGELTEGEVFLHLEAILKGYEASGGGIQHTFDVDWNNLNFHHIPVGVLSQVYESFSRDWDSESALTDSVHYTPKNIAKLIVDQALAGVDDPHRARVLDPSCGAGVFLVLAFRELVRRRWEHEIETKGVERARRPGKAAIHEVLYKQICGFDISESALRLAALGLYITAIELNKITRPPSALHVPESLNDLVLFNHGPSDPTERRKGFALGSLSDEVGDEFNGAFDVVVGNPPWTALRPKGEDEEAKEANRRHNELIDQQFTRIGIRCLKAAGMEKEAKEYKSPRKVPDIPFIWRATEWVRPGGVIGLALEARFVLTQSGTGKTARDSVFKAMTVTGILNGSNLAQTKVWPNHSMPWILFWARNERPKSLGHSPFNVLTPVREDPLCKQGQFRLDFQSAFTITSSSVIQRGWLLKALAMGSVLDVQVQEKLEGAIKHQTIREFWSVSNQGFTVKPWKKGEAPKWLLELPVFHPPKEELEMDNIELMRITFEDHFGNRNPHRSLKKEAYAHPLLLVTERTGENRLTAKSYRVLKSNICFSKSYFGYSAASHEDPALSVAILHLIIHSSLFRHFCFIRSSRIGASWRTVNKRNIDDFPFPELETLKPQDRRQALLLANAIDKNGATNWTPIDRFVCKLFKISKADAEVVNETVEFSAPYKSSREASALPVDDQSIDSFSSSLERSIQPFFNVLDQRAKVQKIPTLAGNWSPPWRFVSIILDGANFCPESALIAKIMRLANETSASRVVMPIPGEGLILGLLNQRRFWTQSRARLCALHISREHLQTAFPVSQTK